MSQRTASGSGQDYIQSTLYQEDSRASRFPWLESKKAKGTTVISGRKCSGLSENLSRVGYLVRTYLESCELPGTRFARTWSVKATTSEYLIMKLRLSEHRIGGKGSSLWATPNTMDYLPQRSPDALRRQAETTRKGRTKPANLREQASPETMRLWPTPTSRDYKDGSAQSCQNVPVNGSLGRAVHMYATPQARDYRTGQASRWESPDRSRNLNDQMGGQLNPDWVEWLMGFPIGYTSLTPQE